MRNNDRFFLAKQCMFIRVRNEEKYDLNAQRYFQRTENEVG